MAKQKNNRFDIEDFYIIAKHLSLTKDERDRVFEWINRNDRFTNGINDKNEDCELFYSRYNPDSQYKVKTLFKGKEDIVECFKYKDRYHTSRTTSINEDFITKITKI